MGGYEANGETRTRSSALCRTVGGVEPERGHPPPRRRGERGVRRWSLLWWRLCCSRSWCRRRRRRDRRVRLLRSVTRARRGAGRSGGSGGSLSVWLLRLGRLAVRCVGGGMAGRGSGGCRGGGRRGGRCGRRRSRRRRRTSCTGGRRGRGLGIGCVSILGGGGLFAWRWGLRASGGAGSARGSSRRDRLGLVAGVGGGPVGRLRTDHPAARSLRRWRVSRVAVLASAFARDSAARTASCRKS